MKVIVLIRIVMNAIFHKSFDLINDLMWNCYLGLFIFIAKVMPFSNLSQFYFFVI
jgi:hypothetical protein